MRNNIGFVQLNDANWLIQPLETEGYYEEIVCAPQPLVRRLMGFIALIGSGIFIRECMRRSMQSAFPLQIQTFSEAVELHKRCHSLPNSNFNLCNRRKQRGKREFQDPVSNCAENTNHCPRLP